MTSKTTAEHDQDASKLVPPEVESGIRLYGFQARHLLYGVPGGMFLLLGMGLILLFGALVSGLLVIGVGILLTVAGITLSMTADEYSTGIDRVQSRVSTALTQRSLPYSRDEAAAIHGVKRIHSDGTAEMEDGRIVLLARMFGRNTDLQDASESRPMIGSLRQAIDDDIEDIDFSIFSSTTPFDAAAVTEKYDDQWRADTYVGEEWRDARALLKNVVEWETEQHEEVWETREWQHYLVIQVEPDEIDLPSFAVAEDEEASRRERLRETVFGVDADESDERWQARRRRMRDEAKQRLSRLRSAFGSVTGIDTQSVGPAEHALLIARYWAGTEHEFTPEQVTEDVNVSVWPYSLESSASARPEAVDADEDVSQAGVASVDRIGAVADGSGRTKTRATASSTVAHDDPQETLDEPDDAADASFLARVREGLFGPWRSSDETATDAGVTADLQPDRLKDLLAPSQYDERTDAGDGVVVAGEQYCRTYWIADWPVEPRETFLEQLYTLRGVDVDVHLRMAARDRELAREELKHTIGEIDANITERKDEANDVEAMLMEDELDPHVKLLKLLRHTEIQPWELSGYVTVRAGTRRALDKVDGLVEEGLVDDSRLTLDIAKQQALEDACEEVEDALTRSPANLTPLADAQRQGDLFESCSPTGRDAYAASSWRSRRRLTASGTIAAAFPPTSTYIRQDEGVEQGRSVTNGSSIIADPFEPGPPHKLTAGDSGSGKTTGALKQAVRWYLVNPEERTLIITDTQTEYTGITQLLNGTQITLDGDVTVNPFHMEPTPPEVLATSGIDPFEMKFNQVVRLVLDIIAESENMRDRFRPLVKDGVRMAMREAGLDPNDPSTHIPENSPTMAEFRHCVREIGENPSAHVDSELVTGEIEEHAGALLHRLSGFTPDGEYGFLTGQSDETIEPGDVTYLDLQQLEGLGSADESTMLDLALGQVYETVKRAPGKTMFIIDEAHYLLESKELLQWLEQSARHWRHNDAGLWFLSQYPGDFVDAEDDDKERSKDVIRSQAQTVELFCTENFDLADAGEYDLNERQATFLRDYATAGEEDEKNYTDCLVDYPTVEGWVRTQIRLSPFEETVYSYDPDEDGDFEAYLDREWGAR